jgi:uncharacterized repeat protein (TIGR03806 family)
MGLAFHPEFGLAGSPNRGYVYVSYSYSPSPIHDAGAPSNTPSYNRLSRFTVPDGSLAADRDTEYVLINQYDRHLWHNGGGMCFDADGFLYVTNGDEGDYGNPYNQGQRVNGGLFGGVLRIDVDRDATRSHPIRRQPASGATPPAGWPASYTQGYYIPNDNPWLDTGGSVLEEYFAIGLRSPHRITFDASTNRLWLGDVGQSTREEVNIIVKGGNYQWGFVEGTIAGPSTKPATIVGTERPPLFEYEHSNGYTAVIGGYVYRGTEHAAHLTGRYLFGDNGTSRIRAMTYDGSSPPSVVELCTLPNGGSETTGMSTFGLDHQNEPLMCCVGIGVKIYKLAKSGTTNDPPALLSQTGAFTDLATLTPSAALVPYTVNSPLWSDGAVKSRWMSVPNDGAPFEAGETIDFSSTGAWTFPVGTVFVKHFELPTNDTNPSVRKRLETRFLVHASNGAYYGLTYKWRADNSDADLLPGSQNEAVTITTATGTRSQTWSYPSRQDCMVCHNTSAGSVLGLRTCQMNGDYAYSEATDNQLRTLHHMGMFSSALEESAIATLPRSVSIHDTTASLELRVRSYLDSNCAHCHRPNGVRANFDARLETPLPLQGLIRGDVADTLGISGARLIMPSDTARSMIRHRDNLVGTNQMPPLARNVVDTDYISVLNQWINSLPPSCTLPVTIGSQSEGSTTDNITDGSGSYINAGRFAASSSGTLTEIHAKVVAITGSYKCAIYADANGSASTLLRTTSTRTNVTEGWQTFALTSPLPITAGSYYWLAIWSDDTAARVFCNSGGTLRWAKYDFGTWPTPVNLGSSSDLTYSIYASGPGDNGGSSTPVKGIVSGSYSWQPAATQTGSRFSAKGLPAGLKINAVTGAITGTPSSSGRFTVQISEAKDRKVTVQTYTLVIEALPPGIAGSYTGLVDRDMSANENLGGSINLTVSATGLLTGRLYHSATSYVLTGRIAVNLDADPTYTQTLPRKGNTPLILNLTFARSNATITGTSNGAAIHGRHHLIIAPGTPNTSSTLNCFLSLAAGDVGDLTKPQGTGWLRLTQSIVSGKASVTAAGKLSDGSTLTLAAGVCDNLDALLRTVLYSGKGSVQGITRITTSPTPVWPPEYTVVGMLDWRKTSPASNSDHGYDAISQSLTVGGKSHVQPASGLTLLGNSDAPENAEIEFIEGGIEPAANANQTFQLTARHKALFGNATTNPRQVAMTVDAQKGTFTGTLKLQDGTTVRMVRYSGLFVGNEGQGFFVLPQLPLTKTSSVLSGKVRVLAP